MRGWGGVGGGCCRCVGGIRDSMLQQTSFPVALVGRMFSCVICAECSLALRRRAAMLDARRSAAMVDVAGEEEDDEGSGMPVDGCTGPSAGGVVWRRRAAAVEALVKGPILENSLRIVDLVRVVLGALL